MLAAAAAVADAVDAAGILPMQAFSSSAKLGHAVPMMLLNQI